VWVETLTAVLAVSLISVLGVAGLVFRPLMLQRVLVLLISFAAGALLGDAFLHIVPEIAESSEGFDAAASFSLLGGVVAFFVLEKILHWHHAHLPGEDVLHPVAVSNLVGDGLHNFVDGAIIAGAFVASPNLGVATTVAVALHEIPQELGDFGILVHAGLKPSRALVLNFLSGLTAVAGGLLTLGFSSVAGVERFLLPFSAGAFVYIASTDLIPELHKEPEPVKSLVQVVALLFGVGVMSALLWLE
jgi:zinc and cadmium transporter